MEEKGAVRDLYRGVLQAAVGYLHILRGNYRGAVKVHERCIKWLQIWPDLCKGINVRQLRSDIETVLSELKERGPERIKEFEASHFKPVQWTEKRIWVCDRCGCEMVEKNCRVICSNCGNRFDCSDLNLYFD